VIDKRQYAILESPFPTLSHEKEVIIRTMAVGLNPIDWKSVDYNFCMPGFPWVNGREMAGIVEHVGSEVDHVQIGQRVWTSEFPESWLCVAWMLTLLQVHTIETAEQAAFRNLSWCLDTP
jgi:NADPH:quinone reductase-like Zn-dependent oxidoreductase